METNSKDEGAKEHPFGLVPALKSGVQVAKNAEGFAQLRIPRPRTRLHRFLGFIFRLPDYKILVLDETGTEMLGLIDGRRTFRELATRLQQSRSLERTVAEVSMAAFLRRLVEERVISMSRSPRDTAPRRSAAEETGG